MCTEKPQIVTLSFFRGSRQLNTGLMNLERLENFLEGNRINHAENELEINIIF